VNVGAVPQGLRATALYAAAARRVLVHSRSDGLAGRFRSAESRLVFVVGSPRSGTTFLAGALGGLPGFVDLTEVTPLKARIPELVGLPREEAARSVKRILDRVRHLAFVYGLRGVEQTPEMAFLAGAALEGYPDGRVIHLIRDGRDVVCSLLERGWLSSKRTGADDAGVAYGVAPRFWVEPERRDEFVAASDATRAAWAWRSYVTAARQEPAAVQLRYEQLVGDPDASATLLAGELGTDPARVRWSLRNGHANSVGRWRRDLTPEQVADVEREAGPLLAELGYV
jgi:Sulfotransferase family